MSRNRSDLSKSITLNRSAIRSCKLWSSSCFSAKIKNGQRKLSQSSGCHNLYMQRSPFLKNQICAAGLPWLHSICVPHHTVHTVYAVITSHGTLLYYPNTHTWVSMDKPDVAISHLQTRSKNQKVARPISFEMTNILPTLPS